jgi:hypothetical protein
MVEATKFSFKESSLKKRLYNEIENKVLIPEVIKKPKCDNPEQSKLVED